MDDFDKQGWMGRHMSAATHCQVIRQLLSDYLDGAIPTEERAGFEAHLSACRECQAELTGLKAMLETLHELPAPQAPDLVPGIHRKLAARAAPAGSPGWPSWLSRILDSSALRPVALGATAVLVIVVVATIPNTVSQKSDVVINARQPQSEQPSVSNVLAPKVPAEKSEAKLKSHSELAYRDMKEETKQAAAPMRENSKRAKDEREAYEVQDKSNEVRKALAANKVASMEQAIEGALSARGRVGARRFDPAKERDMPLANQEHARESAATVASLGGAASAPTASRSAQGPALDRVDANRVGLAQDGAELQAVGGKAGGLADTSSADEPPSTRYQWDVPDFDRASASLNQWVQANFGMVVAIDHRTFLVTLPPVLLQEFSRRFSTRQLSAAPETGAKTDATEADAGASEPFVTVWLELIRSQ